VSTIGPVGAEKYGALDSSHPSFLNFIPKPSTCQLNSAINFGERYRVLPRSISLAPNLAKRSEKDRGVLEGGTLHKARWRAKFLPFRISSLRQPNGLWTSSTHPLLSSIVYPTKDIGDLVEGHGGLGE